MALKQAKVITITSVKGGTGKTTTALNLAGILSMRKKNVLLLDMDLYGSAVAMHLKLEPQKDFFTLVDDLKNNRFTAIDDYVTIYNDYISVLPAPKDPRLASKISSKYLEIVLSKLKPRYDYILMDTNHILDEFNLVALDVSDLSFFLITSDPVDLKNMRTVVSIFTDIDKTNYKIVLNEALSQNRHYFSNYDIKHIVHDNIDYTIPASFVIKNIDHYILDGQILTLDKGIRARYKKGVQALERIADSILKLEELELKK